MSKGKLTNYLRTYRKRAGLTQRELAFLLGLKARGPISEIEKRRRVPLLRTALALAVIFRIPVEVLFSGMCECIASEVDGRAEKLASELTSKVGTKKRCEYHTTRKLQWLQARCSSAATHGPEGPASPRA